MIALGIVLGVLLLINLTPVGAVFRYEDAAELKLKIGPFRKQLIPAKPKTQKQLEKQAKKKAKKAAKKAEQKKKKQAAALTQEPKEPAQPKPLSQKLRELMQWARLGGQLLGSVFRRLRIGRLTVHIRLGGSDCAKLAENCGKCNAAVGAALPYVERVLTIRKRDIQIAPDFVAGETEFYAELSARFLVADLVGIALKYGFRAVRLLFSQKKSNKQSNRKVTEQ